MKTKYICIIAVAVILLPLIVTADKPVEQKTAVVIDQTPTATGVQPSKETESVNSVQFTNPSRAGEEINWQVISSGGTLGTSTNYVLNGTVSQTATNVGTSTNYIVRHGFWQDFGGAILCDCDPGECDLTPPINILDIVYLINYKYKSGPAPAPYELCNGDPNADCAVNILDIVYLINYKYKYGPAPITCEEWVTACGLPLRK